MQYHKEYQHGKGKIDSFDCAGLVWYIYNKIFNIDVFKDGFDLSTTTKIMTSKYGTLTVFKENDLCKNLNLINEGDILFFHRQSLNDNFPTKNNKYPGHCGIYLGKQKFIHASNPKKKVIISDFSKNEYWINILVGSKNVINDLIINQKIKYKEVSQMDRFMDAKAYTNRMTDDIDNNLIDWWINMIKQYGIETIIENGEADIIPIIEQVQFKRNGFSIDIDNNVYIKDGLGAFVKNIPASITSIDDLRSYEEKGCNPYQEILDMMDSEEYKFVIGVAAPNIYGLITDFVGLYCINYQEILRKNQSKELQKR